MNAPHEPEPARLTLWQIMVLIFLLAIVLSRVPL